MYAKSRRRRYQVKRVGEALKSIYFDELEFSSILEQSLVQYFLY